MPNAASSAMPTLKAAASSGSRQLVPNQAPRAASANPMVPTVAYETRARPPAADQPRARMVQSAEANSAAAKSAATGAAPRNRRTASATPQSGAATTRTAASKIGS